MQKLLAGYRYEVDNYKEDQWDKTLQLFNDANIYQTWAYQSVKQGEKNISHFVLKKDGQVVAMAQARILKIPILINGIAYVHWGPIWDFSEKGKDLESFRQALRGMRNEYVHHRGLLLRLHPYLFADESKIHLQILSAEGYEMLENGSSGRTFLMDLSSHQEYLRNDILNIWDHNPRHARNIGLSFIEGYGDDLFRNLIQINNQTVKENNIARSNDINEFRVIQEKLPLELKMRILLCFLNGEPAAGALCCTTGNIGMNIYRVTNDLGRKTGASYLLQRRMAEWAKTQKCSYYTVNGIDSERDPGTYRFKSELCGEYGKDVYYLGQFDSYTNIRIVSLSHLIRKMRYIRKITSNMLRP